jgi:hypothetical protein
MSKFKISHVYIIGILPGLGRMGEGLGKRAEPATKIKANRIVDTRMAMGILLLHREVPMYINF